MKLFKRELHGFPKALVILVAVLLVSTGLCGFQLVVANGGLVIGNSNNGGLEGILFPLGVVELIAMLLSAGGIVLVLALWLVSALIGRLARPSGDEEQRLSERPGDTGDDEPR